jgi:hypothetical protein
MNQIETAEESQVLIRERSAADPWLAERAEYVIREMHRVRRDLGRMSERRGE